PASTLPSFPTRRSSDLTSDLKATDLCVVAKTATGLVVWRTGGFTLAGATLSVATTSFGIYQALYCGTDALAGFVLKGGTVPTVTDRKSTRLNSSHVAIS